MVSMGLAQFLFEFSRLFQIQSKVSIGSTFNQLQVRHHGIVATFKLSYPLQPPLLLITLKLR